MNYWLVKSEPEEFGLDDLACKGREPWTGVRNYQARNFMRDAMQENDLVLFYHSSITPPGVAGLARVACSAYPDPTQFDPKSEYFDPKATSENPRWVMVDLLFEGRFAEFVPLQTLRENPATTSMRVCQTGSRLSVQPVKVEEFKAVCQLGKYKA